MTSRTETLASRVKARFAQQLQPLPAIAGDVAFEVAAADLLSVCRELRDDPQFGFEQLVDLDPLLFNGVVGSAFTRLSSNELANVTAGGGMVPTFVISEQRK